MAIDPMMYQKMSGRSGDPYERMGQVLAQDAKRAKREDRTQYPTVGGGKAKWIFSIVLSLVVLAVLIGALIRF